MDVVSAPLSNVDILSEREGQAVIRVSTVTVLHITPSEEVN